MLLPSISNIHHIGSYAVVIFCFSVEVSTLIYGNVIVKYNTDTSYFVQDNIHAIVTNMHLIRIST